MTYLIRKLKDMEEIKTVCGNVKELIKSSDFKEVSVIIVDVDGETTKHRHKTLTEFYYILDGKIDLELDDAVEHCEEGTLVMIKPGTTHKARGKGHILEISFPAFDPNDLIVVE